MSMLRSIREKKGLTVSQLAARASIPSRVIADYEEGRQSMPLNHARLIAKALWVPIEDLMPPAGSTPPPPANPAPAAPQPAPVYTQPAPQPRPQPQATAPTAATTAAPTAAPAAPPPAPSYPGGGAGYAPQLRPQHDQRPAPRSDSPRGRGPGGPAGKPGEKKSPPHPPGPITEGQLQELARLATRLEIDQAQMEAQIGKGLSALTRPEAKDWIKKLRAIADEIAPTQKSRFGAWPGGEEDREAAYLREQRDAHATFAFKLFNGEQIDGTITDFTPYTITVSTGDGEETVLRKLAIAYYRRTGQSEGGASGDASASTAPEQSGEASPALQANEPAAHNHAADDHHQPLDTGTDSDRAGEPDAPEGDNMDEDRGV